MPEGENPQFDHEEQKEKSSEDIKSPEDEDFTDIFDNLIRMLWYEKKARENPAFEKNLRTITEKVRYSLINHLREYIDSYQEQPLHETAEGAMYWYKVKFKEDIMSEENIFTLVVAINYWLQEIHERMRTSFGGELFGFTKYDLGALNYIDPSKLIEKQKTIMQQAVFKEYEKYQKADKVYFTF